MSKKIERAPPIRKIDVFWHLLRFVYIPLGPAFFGISFSLTNAMILNIRTIYTLKHTINAQKWV